TYRIHLPQFEGPFDLLIFFIERDELDIHDIPIASITNDFLDYVRTMQEMNIELAAEFILVASTLMQIKAKMLLPRPELNEQGEEIDPREELVKRLLEYKRYKGVLEDLKKMEVAQAERVSRGFAKEEEKHFLKSEYPEEELVGLDLYALMRTFKRIWSRHHDELQKPKHVIRRYPYSVQQVKSRLLESVLIKDRVDFVEFIMEEKSRIYAVFCFLSILELVQVQKIAITVGLGYNNFWISRKIVTESPEATEPPEITESPETSD
ncbi:MAG: segregation/condensation protein A, partial [Bacteroidetes bacterium]|nr:segregation/condensation protein A [Bacteroidota bacterium]